MTHDHHSETRHRNGSVLEAKVLAAISLMVLTNFFYAVAVMVLITVNPGTARWLGLGYPYIFAVNLAIWYCRPLWMKAKKGRRSVAWLCGWILSVIGTPALLMNAATVRSASAYALVLFAAGLAAMAFYVDHRRQKIPNGRT